MPPSDAHRVRVVTRLTLQDISEIFRRAMRVSWISENITGAGTTFERPYGDVFDELNADPADFSIIANMGGRGAEIQGSSVHMYAWDKGDHREVHLLVSRKLLSFGAKANKKIGRFVQHIRTSDASTTVTGL